MAGNSLEGFAPDDSHDRYRLRPDQFPRRLELELNPELIAMLQAMSERSGRSVGEIIEELLSKTLQSLPEGG